MVLALVAARRGRRDRFGVVVARGATAHRDASYGVEPIDVATLALSALLDGLPIGARHDTRSGRLEPVVAFREY